MLHLGTLEQPCIKVQRSAQIETSMRSIAHPFVGAMRCGGRAMEAEGGKKKGGCVSGRTDVVRPESDRVHRTFSGL